MGLHVKVEEFLLLSSNLLEILISMPRSWNDDVADGWLCRVEADDLSGAIRGPVTATLTWFLPAMFVLYLLQSPIGWIILSSHVLHMWDLGWKQIIRIVSVPRLGLKLSALFSVYVSRWRWFWIMNIYVINIEWISWPPLLCKHKNAVALRSTRNCCFIGRFVLFMQLHYYRVGDYPQCCVFMHLKLHCCWTGRRLTQD